MERHLKKEDLEKIVEAKSIENVSLSELYQFFIEEEGIAKYIPDGLCQLDPRNYDRILFNTARAKRPHDNVAEKKEKETKASPVPKNDCVICNGNTTGIVDMADLSEGFTFINKNLFPVLYPMGKCANVPSKQSFESVGLPAGELACGFHFLQWTSSYHDRDWHNMPLADRMIVLKRIAYLEEKLLMESASIIPQTDPWSDPSGYQGFVSIVKNYGALVGGSLSHGHQQIALSNIMPNDFLNDLRFESGRGENFSRFMQRVTPGLIIREYPEALLITPYFMRRPYEMMLLLKDTTKRYVHQLNSVELESVAEGWYDAITAIRYLMPKLGRETAFNIVTHNGPGAGLYFDFHPYTQEIGGFEQLGLFICQGNPPEASETLRSILTNGQ